MVLQLEAVECGAACLAIVMASHGRWVPLSQLRQECGVSRGGTKAASLVKAARRHGMEAKGFKQTIDVLLAGEAPVILFWQFNHFVVLEGATADVVHLNDPAYGHRTVTRAEFEKAYTGVVLILRPGPAFERTARPPGPFRAIRRLLAGAGPALLFVGAASLMLAVPTLALPVVTQVFIDEVLIGGADDWLRPMVAALAVMVLLEVLLVGLRQGVQRRLRLALATRMSTRFVEHLLSLPARFFSQRWPGDLALRVGLNEGVASLLAGRLGSAAVDLVMLTLVALVMAWYDLFLTAIAISFAAISLGVLIRVSRLRTEANARVLHARGRAVSTAIGGLQDIQDIKASAMEGDLFARWAGQHAVGVNASLALAQSQVYVSLVAPTLQALATAMVLVVGTLRVMDGELTIGMLIAFRGLMGSFLEPIQRTLDLSSDAQALQADLARIDDVLGQARASRPEGAILSVEGSVSMEDVTFGYSEVDPPLLTGLTLRAAPGAWVALVGGSGSGKTTAARLLAGLAQPWSGAVCIDGRPRADFAADAIARAVAVVDQDVFLFQGSVRDNLTLWDDSVDDLALRDALRDAALLDDVLALPGGLDAVLAERGANLSGGQRQRLELARALVRRPRVLVLDEATAALDTLTERRVLENLRRRGCTTVLVAHRLSTVRDCDEIVVMADGAVVERGDHEGLRAAGGLYARLMAVEGSA